MPAVEIFRKIISEQNLNLLRHQRVKTEYRIDLPKTHHFKIVNILLSFYVKDVCKKKLTCLKWKI